MQIIKKILCFILKIIFRIEIYNKEMIYCEGPVIYCANHISVWEPIILYLVFPREIIFLAKKELFEKPFLGWLLNRLDMIPVDRDKPELSSIKDSINVLKLNKALGIFPQGTRKNEIDENDGKAGVGLIAYKADSPVQPIYFESSYKLFSKVKIVVGDIMYVEAVEGVTQKEIYEKFGRDVMVRIKDLGNESHSS